MSATRPMLAAFAVAALATAMPSALHANDNKHYGMSMCEPYAPDTTAAEIQLTHSGIYNPGTTTEKIICTVLRDEETMYTSLEVAMEVYYRVLGASQGRVTCTLFVGSTSQQNQPVYSNTVSGPLASGGEYGVVYLIGATQGAGYSVVPNTIVCAISPKTSVGSINFYEYGPTNSPLS